MHFYNENDPRAAQWLRELIAAGEIPDGVVDERSILDVQPADLAGFVQCHFFAGIGGWSLALKLAGWPEDRPCWSGSAPCQPYSAAGKGKGDTDARNLWPAFFRLIKACKPECVIGEQVAAAIGHGWLDGVRTDLEGEGYSCGHIVLGAHSAGAPHIRQRIYWCGMADATSPRCIGPIGDAEGETRDEARVLVSGEHGEDGGLEHAAGDGREQRRAASGGRGVERGCESGGLVQSDGPGREPREQATAAARHGGSIEPAGGDSGLDNATGNGAEHGELPTEPGSNGPHHGLSRPSSHWGDYELIPCADGKARRIKSGLQPLAHGVPGRVGLLRGAGNAIVPQVAAEFIKAVMDLKGGENHAKEAKKEKVRRLLTAGSSSA